MIARYAGTCSVCSQPVNVGDSITWSRKHKGRVLHTICPTATATTASNDEMPACTACGSNACITLAHEAFCDEGSHYCVPCMLYFTPAVKTESVITTKPLKVPTESNNNGSHAQESTDDLSMLIAQAIARHLPPSEPAPASIDESVVREIVKSELAGFASPTIVTVAHVESGETRDMGLQHNMFPKLLKVLSTKLNVWLAGPSGSGKTQAAMNVATALDQKFYFCGAQSNEYGLSGFVDAAGKTVRTLFREAYEHGGIFLFDEVDASSPSALLWLNAALSNGHCAFPDAVVERHENFVCIAAANTWGLGGTNDYVGRMKMDAAFLKRFVFVSWDYDESLETAISGNATWAKRVQTIRKRARSKGIKVIISPRETIYGTKLLAAGLDESDVEDMTVLAGLDSTQKESIR